MDHSNPAPATTPAKAQRVLVLQGGGALGSYQAGAFQALCRSGFEPEWIAGISIGAINAAIIAGNEAREARRPVERILGDGVVPGAVESRHKWRPRALAVQRNLAALIATFGVPGFFTPRIPPAPLWPPGSPQSQSYYDTAPLEEDAGTAGRLRSHQRSEDAAQRRRGRRDLGQFQIFRQFRIQEARQEDRPGAHHGVRRAAAGLSFRRDRRRALLGRRHRLQHAARLRAGRGNQPRSPDLPGRSVQRARRPADVAAGSRRAGKGHPLFQPHPHEYRQEQAGAQHAQGAARAARKTARQSQERSVGGSPLQARPRKTPSPWCT